MMQNPPDGLLGGAQASEEMVNTLGIILVWQCAISFRLSRDSFVAELGRSTEEFINHTDVSIELSRRFPRC